MALPIPETFAHDDTDVVTEAVMTLVPRKMRQDAARTIPLIITTARQGGITHRRRLAYVLATVHVDAGFGARLTDRASELDAPETERGRMLGNVEHDDAERFRGRGFVRVRGRAAYASWSQRLGLTDRAGRPYLVAHPDAMANETIAARVLVRGMRDGLFTGFPLGTFVNDRRTNYESARRVVGDTTHVREIAALAWAYEAVLDGRAPDAGPIAVPDAALGSEQLYAQVTAARLRLAAAGHVLPEPTAIVPWTGDARQGKFLHLDDQTCALDAGAGVYVVLDITRDLGGLIPPEGKNFLLKRACGTLRRR